MPASAATANLQPTLESLTKQQKEISQGRRFCRQISVEINIFQLISNWREDKNWRRWIFACDLVSQRQHLDVLKQPRRFVEKIRHGDRQNWGQTLVFNMRLTVLENHFKCCSTVANWKSPKVQNLTWCDFDTSKFIEILKKPLPLIVQKRHANNPTEKGQRVKNLSYYSYILGYLGWGHFWMRNIVSVTPLNRATIYKTKWKEFRESAIFKPLPFISNRKLCSQ